LLKVGAGPEDKHGAVLRLDDPHPAYADRKILPDLLPYFLPTVIGRHDFDDEVWGPFEKSFGGTLWPAFLR
jgi:hypothetical protein